jgi:poly(3-hydroxybutyrate) depolymerase
VKSSRPTKSTCLLAALLGGLTGACSGAGARPCGYLACDSGTAFAPPDGDGTGFDAAPLDLGPRGDAFDPKGVQRSQGCGKPRPADQPATVQGTPHGYLKYSVMLTGTTLAGNDPTRASPRTFWVRVPADYDPSRAYRLVYVAQGCGGYNVANTSTFPLFDESRGGTEQAVYVALDIPTDMQNQDCYDFRGGLGSEEWEAFAAIQSVVDANYCVDDDAIFIDSYGDDGTSLSNMWGCYFAGNPVAQRRIAPARHIRGQLSVSGGEPMVQPPCGGPIAALWIHDLIDGSPYDSDVHALDRVLAGNGCQGDHTSSPTAPWAPMPDVCLRYTTCPTDYPVVFCTTMDQGHASQPERAIPAFRAFEDLVSPTRASATSDAGSSDAGAADAAGQ